MLILDRAFCIRRHSPAAMGSGDRSRKINWMALITRSGRPVARASRAMRSSWLRAWTLIPLLTVFVSTTASAQDISLRAEHERGLRLRDENHNEEALAVFQHIYELTREPRALARMALAEGALNRWSDAEAHLVLAVAARRDPWIHQNRAGLMQNLQVIRSHVGTVQVNCNVSGAELLVRGVRVGTFPLPQPLRLSEGSNEFEVHAEGYATSRQAITVVPNGNLSVVIALAAEASSPSPRALVSAPPPPPPAPRACATGQVISDETAGHCCWPGQVWSSLRSACIGTPQCPPGFAASGETCATVGDAPATAAPPARPPSARTLRACATGQVISEETAGHCCWPGQVWSSLRSTCVGAPQCPSGFAASGETCSAMARGAAPASTAVSIPPHATQ